MRHEYIALICDSVVLKYLIFQMIPSINGDVNIVGYIVFRSNFHSEFG